MDAADYRALAGMVKAMRLASAAAGSNLSGRHVEVLLWIAAGVDTVNDLAEATGLNPNNVKRSVRFLSGRTVNKGASRRMISPFRLISTRPHPHQGHPHVQVYLNQPIP